MKHYKWCVCDMDGTLLDSKKRISEDNLGSLMKLKQKGVSIILASGRLDLMIKTYIKQLELKGDVISCNGGLIRNIETGEIVYSSVIEQDMAKKIIQYAQQKKINYLIYTPDFVYSNQNNPRTLEYENNNLGHAQELQIPLRYVDEERMKNLNTLKILKVLYICDSQKEVEDIQSELSTFQGLEVVSSAEGLLDIMRAGTTKGKALKFLAEQQKVSLEEVIAFGDNYNDIEMLSCVGMPIAMENSVDPVKLAAKFITKSNEESGIAYAIDIFLQDEKSS